MIPIDFLFIIKVKLLTAAKIMFSDGLSRTL